MQEIIIINNQFVHLTANSGVRLRGADARTNQLQCPCCDFAVIESESEYTAVVSRTSLTAKADPRKTTLTSEQLDIAGPFETFDEAVNFYFSVFSAPAADQQKRTRPKRAITIDMWLSNGRISHTYADVVRLIDELEKLNLTEGTLVYLPGWHAIYDTRFPLYEPADELGGGSGFKAMITAVKQAGAIIMPHLNFWGYSVDTGLLGDYQEFQVKDEHGQPMAWPGVLKTGYTNPLVYMRVDDPRWQKAFFQFVEPLITDYELDALFLDQLGFYHGMNKDFDDASLDILCKLRANKPDILLGGEIFSGQLQQQIDLCQAWGQPWCGLDVDFSDAMSPIVGKLFGDNITFISHLGLPCATPCDYCWTNYPFIVEQGYQKAFEIAQSHIKLMSGLPHVRLAYNRFGIDPVSLAALK